MEAIPSIKFFNENDEEITLSCIYVVCSRCRGKGKIVNPSIDGHGITAQEFHEDPDFHEEYMSGMYDIACPECKGKRVVPEPSVFTNSKEDIKAYERHLMEEAEYEAMVAAERRMGC